MKLQAQAPPGEVNMEHEHVHVRIAQLMAKVYKRLSKHASENTQT
jgi:hypothetical protein